MLKVSNGPIRISKRDIGNAYEVNSWGLLDVDTYNRLIWFEDVVPVFEDFNYGEIDQTINANKLKFSGGSSLYQLTTLHNPAKSEYIRLQAVMNNKDAKTRIRPVSNFDVYVKYPVLSMVCKVLNLFARRS